VRYTEENAHTTLTAIESPLFGFEPTQGLLDRLSRAAEAVAAGILREVVIDFREWLATEDSVIVAGYPTSAFWEVGEHLQSAGLREGLELRMPWAAHMTAVRFTSSQEGEAVGHLLGLVRQGPVFGVSRPVAIDVGWFRLSGEGYELHTAKSMTCM
jgi:hypothetical protein